MTLISTLRASWLALLFSCLLIPIGGAALALDDAYMDQWESMVQRVDRILEADVANEQTLERLRVEVVAFRDKFQEEESANQTQLERVRRQLDTLGPEPAEGETEAEEVQARRASLEEELSRLRAPSLRATEAFAEADEIVSDIDAELRARQTRLILERFPLPVNPLNWEEPLAELKQIALDVPTEIYSRLSNDETRSKIIGNLPSAGLSLIAGALMLFRSRYWSNRLAKSIHGIRKPVPRKLLNLLNVVAQLALPWIGLSLLVAALQLTGIFGPTGSTVLLAVVAFGFAMILGTWLVARLFPWDEPENSPLLLSPKMLPKARRTAFMMVVTLSLYQGIQVLEQRLSVDDRASAYSGFILSIITAVGLFRMARFFRRSVSASQVEEDDRAFVNTVVSVVALIGMIASLVAVLAGLAGYVVLARQVIYPAAGTFFLFGFLALTQRGFADMYAAIVHQTHRDEPLESQARVEDSLVPTLIGALLVVLSLPAIALMWGARVTDLTELWAQVRGGFMIGDVRISPTEFFTFLLVFAFGYMITRLIQGGLRNSILPKTKLDIGARTAIVSGVSYLGIFLAAIAAITTAGIDMSSFAIFASALAVGIGFGLQTIVSNFVSGIILLIERPVAEGDWIEVGGVMGHVRSISVRATRIETFDKTSVIVPNADLVSGVVTNWTKGNSIGRVIVPVGVAYGTDTRRVEGILSEIANAHPMIVISPPPSILFIGFGADSLDFEIRAILRDVNFLLAVKSDLNHEIAARFTEENIEIPFAQRDVWLRNPETLAAAAPNVPKATLSPPKPMQADEVPGGEADGDGDGEST